LRYEGQSYELTIPVARADTRLSERDVADTIGRFHETHRRIYAYGEPEERVEFVSLRLAATGRAPKFQLERHRKTTRAPIHKGRRPVYFFDKGFVPARLYERSALRAGQTVRGPSLIEETTSTTVIPPGFVCQVDGYGNLLIETTGPKS
jgi:N-methylhydantoinase A